MDMYKLEEEATDFENIIHFTDMQAYKRLVHDDVHHRMYDVVMMFNLKKND